MTSYKDKVNKCYYARHYSSVTTQKFMWEFFNSFTPDDSIQPLQVGPEAVHSSIMSFSNGSSAAEALEKLGQNPANVELQS
ncbi:hypothetical protein Bhyg_09686 [Pseudolycoriella hygida]|uniref:Uncharacterized protein n=1 Tax=Pseudolycoriella hygida TaxID=35572 RepID=A0A9Q0RWN7_9DIPT|nr:hypothetical protein Bhyg_09686 [Pseudolycoriella hygida]